MSFSAVQLSPESDRKRYNFVAAEISAAGSSTVAGWGRCLLVHWSFLNVLTHRCLGGHGHGTIFHGPALRPHCFSELDVLWHGSVERSINLFAFHSALAEPGTDQPDNKSGDGPWALMGTSTVNPTKECIRWVSQFHGTGFVRV